MALPLLLVPGMMCDARLFGPQIAAFSAGRSVYVANLASGDTIGAMARSVLDQAPAEFALAGLSLGGIIAMEMIRQEPARIRGLALMDTNPKAETAEVATMREPQIAAAKAGRMIAVMREEMKPNYLAETSNRKEILDLCLAMALDLGAEVFVRQSRALQNRPDAQDTLKTVTVPSLVLMGVEDRLCPLHRHELMRDLIPDAKLALIDAAGHLPTLEQPVATNAALTEWLVSL